MADDEDELDEVRDALKRVSGCEDIRLRCIGNGRGETRSKFTLYNFSLFLRHDYGIFYCSGSSIGNRNK